MSLEMSKCEQVDSQHTLDKECSKCGDEENEVYLFFLCPFAKAAWFTSPWHIRSEAYATNHHSVPAII
jgi:hypothetical protein